MSPPLLGAYLTHMTAAAGYYQHFLLKLQFKFRLEQVSGLVDWLPSMEVLAEILPATEGEDDSALAHDEATVQWVVQAVRRTLIALGDIGKCWIPIVMSMVVALACELLLFLAVVIESTTVDVSLTPLFKVENIN